MSRHHGSEFGATPLELFAAYNRAAAERGYPMVSYPVSPERPDRVQVRMTQAWSRLIDDVRRPFEGRFTGLLPREVTDRARRYSGVLTGAALAAGGLLGELAFFGAVHGWWA